MLRSGQTAIDREAGGRERLIPRFSAAPCAIANTCWERLLDDMGDMGDMDDMLSVPG